MLKKIYFLLIFTAVLVCLSFMKKSQPIVFKPVLLNLEKITARPPTPTYEALVLLNSRNQLIKNIVFNKIKVKVEGFNLDSKLFYEKSLRFRMINWSILGKETDIGSNDSFFWFWSKRMSPPAVYWAKHEDLYKTRLKTPFHPLWMMEIIGVNTIDLENSTVFEHGHDLAIVQHKLSVLGQPIVRIYLVDPVKQAFIGHYIYDVNGKLVVSAEINTFQEIAGYHLPKSMTINWVEENIQINWELDTPLINCQIDSTNWDCDLKNKELINLKGYIPKSVPVF